MNNKALNTVGAKIQDVASSVVNSKWGQAVIPTANELNQTISSNTKLAGSLYNENIQKSLTHMFEGLNVPTEEATRMAKTVNVKNYDKAINALSEDISEYTDKPVEKVIERAKTVTQKEISKGIDPENLSIPDKILKYPGAYFTNPDNKIKNTRIATAVTAYAGTAVGARYLSGGTLTTDNYGRKDIAGVPFL